MSFVLLQAQFLGLKSWRIDLFQISNTITIDRCLVQCEVHFEKVFKKISYDPFVILIMRYNIWEINFNYMIYIKKRGN